MQRAFELAVEGAGTRDKQGRSLLVGHAIARTKESQRVLREQVERVEFGDTLLEGCTINSLVRSRQIRFRKGAQSVTVADEHFGLGLSVRSRKKFLHRKVDQRSSTEIKLSVCVSHSIDRAAGLERNLPALSSIAKIFRRHDQGDGLDLKRIVLGESSDGIFNGHNAW